VNPLYRLTDNLIFMQPLEEDVERISDNISHISMEVNTTGTGSIRVR
jgi:hypothetical protein